MTVPAASRSTASFDALTAATPGGFSWKKRRAFPPRMVWGSENQEVR
jgi:hypothetical protein